MTVVAAEPDGPLAKLLGARHGIRFAWDSVEWERQEASAFFAALREAVRFTLGRTDGDAKPGEHSEFAFSRQTYVEHFKRRKTGSSAGSLALM